MGSMNNPRPVAQIERMLSSKEDEERWWDEGPPPYILEKLSHEWFRLFWDLLCKDIEENKETYRLQNCSWDTLQKFKAQYFNLLIKRNWFCPTLTYQELKLHFRDTKEPYHFSVRFNYYILQMTFTKQVWDDIHF